MGLVGILIFLAGAHLIWRARREVLYWVQEFVRILRGEFSRRSGLAEGAHPTLAGLPAGNSSAEDTPRLPRRRRSGTLLLLGGFALIILGQVLFLLDIAL
jgi:hypothetical protein